MAAKKKKYTQEFTIDRKTWLQGEGSEASRLLRPEDNKRCCLGFYLESCGVSVRKLLDKKAPSDVNCSLKRGAWLLTGWNDREASHDASELMTINDCMGMYKRSREKRVRELFAGNGILVKFKGKYPKKGRRSLPCPGSKEEQSGYV
jgi:hypothetical protein